MILSKLGKEIMGRKNEFFDMKWRNEDERLKKGTIYEYWCILLSLTSDKGIAEVTAGEI